MSSFQNPFRFAGDVFSGVGTSEEDQEREKSQLATYFPQIRDYDKRLGGNPKEGARTTGGFEAIDPFTGYKEFESKGEFAQVPKFGGFKQVERS